MQKSDSIKNLAAALILFHVKVENIKKDASNPFFKSKYASLSNILDAITDPLAEAGLTFSQHPTDANGLCSLLIHAESGEYLMSEFDMKPVKDDPQGRGSCITYQRRYALSAILGLNIEDDDDANTATHGGKTPEAAEDANKPWLNKGTPQFEGAVKKLSEKTTTMPKIRTVMKVSKEVETALLEAVKNYNHVTA